MVINPHKVLGVPQGASQDEIKKAYRRKAKECHPDLHPDDPHAKEKMQEINEAYDMLMNPDKYRSRPQQGNPYGQGYGSYGNPYGQGGYGQQGYGGWSPFDDMFGSGGYYSTGGQVPPPHEMPGDSDYVRQAVRYINAGQYQSALYVLNGVSSADRNGRWHYLSALANYGMGSTIAAMEQMQRAVELDPGNPLYRQLLDQFRQAGQTYQTNSRGFNMHVFDPGKLCLGLCLLRTICPYCWCCC